MKYWLVKSEPDAYSWQRLVNEKTAVWDGVRNYQARNNLMAMKKGDLVLFYHSVSEKQVMGIAQVTKEHFPDPTIGDPRWVAVELTYYETLARPVSLTAIKNDERLQKIPLLRQSRLSVMPLQREQFDIIVASGQTE